MRFRTGKWLGGLLALAIVASGCGGKGTEGGTAAPAPAPGNSGSSPAQNQTAPKKGGSLKVAVQTNPPTLDPHATTLAAPRMIGVHIFETLFTYNEEYKVQPQLATAATPAADGLSWTITLREGIKFHNGKTMTADDVAASIERFRKVSARKSDLSTVKEVQVVDPKTVKLVLSKPTPILVDMLASPTTQLAIMPKEVKDVPASKLTDDQLIGTGPYKLVEWKRDQSIKLARFDGYQAETAPASGLAGKKAAYLDEITFLPVTEPGSRMSGMEAAEYDFAEALPFRSAERIKENKDLVMQVLKPEWWVVLEFNPTIPPFNNVKMRQAVLAALDEEKVMKAVAEYPEFYRLDPGMIFKEQAWHSDAAKELFNQKNPEKAKQLLKEAGYNGEEIVMLSNKDYDFMYKAALATQAQLKEIGMNIRLDIYDWTGQRAKENDRKSWNLTYTGNSLRFDPSGLNPNFYSKADRRGYSNPQMDQLVEAGMAEGDFQKRFQIYEQIQKLMYEDVPVIKQGDLFGLQATQKSVQGYKPWYTPFFYNVWLSK
jgi:peptide/nickel transport system substrate-binding protein